MNLTSSSRRGATAFLALTGPFALGACAGTSPMSTPVPAPISEAPAPLQEGEDFVVYTADGRPATVDDIVAAMVDHDAVFVGEEHNDPVTHRVQALLLQRAFLDHASSRTVVLSLEMFERDVQYIVDEYLDDLITESHFRSSARPWENYEADYRPMVEFAKAHDLEVVAANAPRRYVNRASRLGRDSLGVLGPEATRHLPPLPYPEASPDYQAEWDALMGEAAAHMRGAPLDGQTLWDASMGHAVASALDRVDGALVLHMAGGFHVENATGTPEALQHYRPGSRSLIVAARPAADPSVWDAERLRGLGDFVVVTRAPAGG
jgi:uncharacterized iron-regulated protein